MVLGIEVAILRGKWLLSCVSRRVGLRFEVWSRVAYLANMQLLFEGGKSRIVLDTNKEMSIA